MRGRVTVGSWGASAHRQLSGQESSSEKFLDPWGCSYIRAKGCQVFPAGPAPTHSRRCPACRPSGSLQGGAGHGPQVSDLMASL